MEHELRALRLQLREKSIFSAKLQKEVYSWFLLSITLQLNELLNLLRYIIKDWICMDCLSVLDFSSRSVGNEQESGGE